MKKQRKIKLIYFLYLIILLFIGCNKDDSGGNNPIVDSQIIASPSKITMNDNETKTISLSVQPANKFNWNVSSKPDWIDISPSSGTINDKILELKITPNSTGLSQGKHLGEIEIITNGAGKAKIDIELNVNAHPVCKVNPTEISYSITESEKTINISNTGTGSLNWSFKSLPDWISVDKQSGVLNEGDNNDIIATAKRNGLPVGKQTELAVVTSNSDEGDVNVKFEIDVPAQAIMTISKEALNYDYFENSKSFLIKNEGNIPFNWSWDNNSNLFLTANPNSGTLSVGESIEVTLTVDRTNLNTQTYNLDVFFNNNKGQTISLPVKINHYKEEKWLIDGKIIDAEYDRNNDVIIVVSEAPNELRKFDLSNKSVKSLKLNIPPTCVSVGQDGEFAAVGHNGSFTHVDLVNMENEYTYAVTADAFDIILAPNNWVYVFPREDQWERIRCVNLTTGIETLHTGNLIYDRTKVKLHPSGKYIYGADNGLSPSDFEKYDINNGTAQYLYDSPYHGDFAFSGDIWISEDGNRLFARSRNVFNSSFNKDNDMTYNGELAGEGKVETLDFSANAGKIYTIFATGNFWEEEPGNEVRIYETEYLAFQGTVKLPGFLIPDGKGGGKIYDSQGYFGFFNSAGTKFYVLVKVAEGAGAQNEWAIATIDVE